MSKKEPENKKDLKSEKTEKIVKKSSYSKKRKQKKILLKVLHLYNLLLITQLYQ